MPARTTTSYNKAASREIQAGLRMLIRGFRRLAVQARNQTVTNGASARAKPSPGRRIHGKYIGLIRNLSIRDKAKVRAIRAKRGVEAAIKMAQEVRRAR